MQEIRNIAIIAHVDHGKTTLVDKMMLAGNLLKEQDNDALTLDNNDLERERGITILSKNVSIEYKNTKINIIDTPGHSDFGGEVERVLNMADGCLLLVDAFEGPMPQTRFVLQKALQIGLKPIVVVNKVDKPNCRPDEVHEMVFDLMFSLDATEEQLDFPVIFGSAKNNWMSKDWRNQTDSIIPLLDAIIEHIPAPEKNEGTPQMLITSLDYSPYTGRIAIGRIHRGELNEGSNMTLVNRNGEQTKVKIKELHTFEGLGRRRTQSVGCGDICAIVGLEKIALKLEEIVFFTRIDNIDKMIGHTRRTLAIFREVFSGANIHSTIDLAAIGAENFTAHGTRHLNSQRSLSAGCRAYYGYKVVSLQRLHLQYLCYKNRNNLPFTRNFKENLSFDGGTFLKNSSLRRGSRKKIS